MAVFWLDDPTGGHIIEIYRDKLPYKEDFELG